MAKTEKELQDLKEKVEEINSELKELSDEELEQVAGGAAGHYTFKSTNMVKERYEREQQEK